MTEETAEPKKGRRKKEPPAPPPPFSLGGDGAWETEDPVLSIELAKQVTLGLLKTVRNLVPTFEDSDGKKHHRSVAVQAGAIYISQGPGHFIGVCRPNLEEFCKKKSRLREAVALAGPNLNCVLNYGSHAKWLTDNHRSVRRSMIGPSGFRFVVAEGVLERRMAPTPQAMSEAEAVRRFLEERVLEDHALSGPFEPPELAEGEGGSCVLGIFGDGVRIQRRLENLGGSGTQIRLKPKLLPKGSRIVRTYADPKGERIVHLRTVSPEAVTDQYFRVLAL